MARVTISLSGINYVYNLNDMSQAWVLINTEMGKTREALDELRKVHGVKEAHLVTGDYDILVLVEIESMEELKNIISWNIRKLEQVRNSITMIVI